MKPSDLYEAAAIGQRVRDAIDEMIREEIKIKQVTCMNPGIQKTRTQIPNHLTKQTNIPILDKEKSKPSSQIAEETNPNSLLPSNENITIKIKIKNHKTNISVRMFRNQPFFYFMESKKIEPRY